VILATWEPKIRRIIVLSQLVQKNLQDTISMEKVGHDGIPARARGLQKEDQGPGLQGQKTRLYLQNNLKA
jgi:hypothetical protein